MLKDIKICIFKIHCAISLCYRHYYLLPLIVAMTRQDQARWSSDPILGASATEFGI